LNWLRNGKPESEDPTGEFTKVDQLLPKKKQSDEDRARDIEGALDWMRNRGVEPSDESPEGTFEKLGSFPISRRSPEERSGDVDDIMTWMRTNKDDQDDPTGEFTKIDQMLPKKKGQKPEERAREIESALDWMRNTGVKPSDNVPPGVFQKLSQLPLSKKTPEERKKEVDEIMTWVRNPTDAKLDPTGEFRRVHQMLPVRKAQKPEDRARDIEAVLDWQRNHPVDDDVVDDEGIFEKLGSVPISKRTPEDRKADEDAVLDWIRSGKDATKDPTGEFETIDQLLPSKRRQSPEERAKDIEGSLDWMRNNDVPPSKVNELPFEIADMMSALPKRGNKGTRPDDDNLDWMRMPGSPADFEDENLPFNRPGDVNSIPRDGPLADSDDPEMNWSRHKNNESVPGVADEDVDPFDKPGMLNSIPTSRDGPGPDDDDNYDWIRQPGVGTPLDDDKVLPFDRPGEIQSIPRDGHPKSEDHPESDWTRNANKSAPGVDEDDVEPFERPGLLNSLPKPRDDSDDQGSEDMDWTRYPNQKVPGVPEEEMPFTKPGDVRSIPRHGMNKPEDDSEFMWARHVPEDEYEVVQPFEKPPPSNRVSRSKRPEEDDDEDEISWIRSVFPDYTPTEDEENVFDRPEDLRSIPRTGKPKASEDPEFGWARSGGKIIPGIPEDDDVFTRPAVRDIPRDGVPPDDDTESIGEWSRSPSTRSLVPEEENVFDRPGDIRSIPRNGKPHEEGYPELSWNRNPAFKIQSPPEEENVLIAQVTLDRFPALVVRMTRTTLKCTGIETLARARSRWYNLTKRTCLIVLET
jgi:hypothetical protein